MLVTISSVRGAPGVTSWALLLAAAWPPGANRERIVLEADCAGGVLGARYQLGVDPGAVTLVSACRRQGGAILPEQHGRLLADGIWAVPGPEVAEQAVPVWGSGAADVVDALGGDDRLWLADLGRAGPDSPVQDLARGAAVNVVATGPAVEDVVQVPARVAALSEYAPTGVLVVGRCEFGEDELHRFLGGRALWVVPGADRLPELAMRAVQGGRSRRSGPWRAATEVAADLALLCRSGRRSSEDRGGGAIVRPAEDGGAPAPAMAPARPGPPVEPSRHPERAERAEPSPEPPRQPERAAPANPSTDPPIQHAPPPPGRGERPERVLSPALRAAMDHRRQGRSR